MVPEPVEGKARRFESTATEEFKVQSSTVPEPVEGKVRRFDKLSDLKVQSSKFKVQKPIALVLS